jgi:inner membrane protein
MTARTHDMISFASLVTVASFYPPQSLNIPTFFAALVGNVVGSLVPDMDQASNRLWDLLPAGNLVGRVFRNLFLAHRTLSHSLLGLYIFYQILAFLLPKIFNLNYINPNIVLVSMMVGYVSHLVADSLTKEGLPLFFPLKIHIGFPPIPALRIKTGGWIEKFVVFPGTLIYLFWFIGQNQERLLGIVRLLKV